MRDEVDRLKHEVEYLKEYRKVSIERTRDKVREFISTIWVGGEYYGR